jgi:signal transduction histidine kinase
MSEIYYFILLGICLLIGLTVIYQTLAERIYSSSNSMKYKFPFFRKDRDHTFHHEGTDMTGNFSDFPKLREENARLTESVHRLEDENKILLGRIHAFGNQNETLAKHNDELNEINRQLKEDKEKLQAQKMQLEELHRRKDELFAITIHDLKNPAGALKGFVDILRTYELSADEQRSIIEHITNLTIRIVEITKSISTILAQAENKDTLQRKLYSIKPIIDEVCNQNKAYAESKNVQIINNSSPDTPPIFIDEYKIEKAIGNLIDNAIKFARAETIVRITSYFDAINVVLEISDNGVGMSKEDIALAFSRGAKLSAQPTGNENSSGLGLWIVKQIIEGHQGTIAIESKVDIGTKFIIRLPIKAEA